MSDYRNLVDPMPECEQCGTPYPRRSGGMFCSDECAQAREVADGLVDLDVPYLDRPTFLELYRSISELEYQWLKWAAENGASYPNYAELHWVEPHPHLVAAGLVRQFIPGRGKRVPIVTSLGMRFVRTMRTWHKTPW